MKEFTEKNLRQLFSYYSKFDPTAVEEYFLKLNIPPEPVIKLCSRILDDPKDPLLKGVLWMMGELAEIQGLSASQSSAWIEDDLKACREQKILSKIIFHLNHPSLSIKKQALRGTLTFLRSAVIDWKSSYGYREWFHLGLTEIDQVKNAESYLRRLKKRHRKSKALHKSISDIFRYLKEADDLKERKT